MYSTKVCIVPHVGAFKLISIIKILAIFIAVRYCFVLSLYPFKTLYYVYKIYQRATLIQEKYRTI